MSIYKKILELSKKYEMDTARFLGDMIKIPAFSTKEKEVVGRIAEEMKRIGFDEVKIDGLGNVIGRLENGKRTIAFDAHIDTVYPGD
ncbi:MAG: YgeY family selenium metabolism-linked hydrolase, partial [Myxococcota bacterium]